MGGINFSLLGPMGVRSWVFDTQSWSGRLVVRKRGLLKNRNKNNHFKSTCTVCTQRSHGWYRFFSTRTMECQITGFRYLILIWGVGGDVVPVGRVVLVWLGLWDSSRLLWVKNSPKIFFVCVTSHSNISVILFYSVDWWRRFLSVFFAVDKAASLDVRVSSLTGRLELMVVGGRSLFFHFSIQIS